MPSEFIFFRAAFYGGLEALLDICQTGRESMQEGVMCRSHRPVRSASEVKRQSGSPRRQTVDR
jgi:hypothetical protein